MFLNLKREYFKLTCVKQWKGRYVTPFLTLYCLCLIDELIFDY